MADSAPMALCVIFYFIIPSSFAFFRYCRNGPHPLPKREVSSLVTWSFVVKRIPWGLIFLVGAGYAMNHGMIKSGLAKIIDKRLNKLKDWPYEASVLIIIIGSAVLSQVFVSIAAINTIMSFLLPMTTKFTVHPLRLCLPASIVACGAYLLPVSGSSLGMVTALGNIKPGSIFIIGLLPWCMNMLFTYILAVAWMRVIFPEYDHYPDGLKANLTAYDENITDSDNYTTTILFETTTIFV